MVKLRFGIFLALFSLVAHCSASTSFAEFRKNRVNQMYAFKKACENKVLNSATQVQKAYASYVLNPAQACKQRIASMAYVVKKGAKSMLIKTAAGTAGVTVLASGGTFGKFIYDSAKEYGCCLSVNEQGLIDKINKQDSEVKNAILGYVYANDGKLNQRASCCFREFALNQAIEKKNIPIVHMLLEYKYPEQAKETVFYPIDKQALKLSKLQLVAMQLCGKDTVTGQDSISKQVQNLQSVIDHKELKKRKSWDISFDIS